MAQGRPRFMGAGATVAALALVAALGFLESRSRREVIQSTDFVTHTLRVQRELGRARTLLIDAETGQRGYLLTSDESYLAPNEQAIAAIPASLARLRELTADEPAQQQRVARLEALATARLGVLRETIALAKNGQRERAIELVVANRAKGAMADIRAVIQSAVNEEERLLQAREAQLSQSIARRGLEVQILIGLMALGLVAVVALIIRLNSVLATHD